MSVSHEGAGAL